MADDFRELLDQSVSPGRIDAASLHEARISCDKDVNAMVPDLMAGVWVGCSVERSWVAWVSCCWEGWAGAASSSLALAGLRRRGKRQHLLAEALHLRMRRQRLGHLLAHPLRCRLLCREIYSWIH